MKLSTHACLAQLDRHQTCKPVMVSVVSSSPTGGNFTFLRQLNANFGQRCQKCQICVIYENLVYVKTANCNYINLRAKESRHRHSSENIQVNYTE